MIRKTKMSFQPSQAPQTCQATKTRQMTGRMVIAPVMIRSRVSLWHGLDVVGDGLRWVGDGAHVVGHPRRSAGVRVGKLGQPHGLTLLA
jgi:hypothetical protein